jgi:regulator of sigma E protease
VHETGHFIAARLSGVTVETFSIGMGPVLAHKTHKGTDYRISLIPLGGYCGMKGEKDYQKALDENLKGIPKTPDSFYGVHPLKRAAIALAGPASNFLFAVIAFMIIALVGYTFYSADNRVILADEIYDDVSSPARVAGLQTGDRILSINGISTETFADISREVSTRPNEHLTVVADRNGRVLQFSLVPMQDPETLAGRIGVVNWIEPVIAEVLAGSPAERAGLRSGDVITAINGAAVENAAQVQKLAGKTENIISYRRSGLGNLSANLVFSESEQQAGISFSVPSHKAKRLPLFPAIGQGVSETANILVLSVKSVAMLFSGVDISKTVSGPVRITVMLGDTVKSGFTENFNAGLVSTLNFMALISVSLFLMNLLPIPILDGGLILFALIEFFRRRQVRPKILYYVQFAGIAFIALLFVVALFSDIGYLRTR